MGTTISSLTTLNTIPNDIYIPIVMKNALGEYVNYKVSLNTLLLKGQGITYNTIDNYLALNNINRIDTSQFATKSDLKEISNLLSDYYTKDLTATTLLQVIDDYESLIKNVKLTIKEIEGSLKATNLQILGAIKDLEGETQKANEKAEEASQLAANATLKAEGVELTTNNLKTIGTISGPATINNSNNYATYTCSSKNGTIVWTIIDDLDGCCTVDQSGKVTIVKNTEDTIQLKAYLKEDESIYTKFTINIKYYNSSEDTSLLAIDVGLWTKVKWGNMNLGAPKPTLPGEYLPWGDITGKSTASENYIGYSGSAGCISGNELYDICTHRLGKGWRLPTLEDFEDLWNAAIKKEYIQNDECNYFKLTFANKQELYFPYSGDKGYELNSTTGKKELITYHTDNVAFLYTGDYNQNPIYAGITSPSSPYFGQASSKWALFNIRPVYGPLKDDVKLKLPFKLVDMGMAVWWADRNLGAENVDDLGNYYSFGETGDNAGTKTNFTKETDTLYNQETKKYSHSEIFTSESNGGVYSLLPHYDIVSLQTKGYCHTPTSPQLYILSESSGYKNNLIWKEETLGNGTKGIKVTSNITNNSIFIPYGGYYLGTEKKDCDNAYYWGSSSYDGNITETAYFLNSENKNLIESWFYRYKGLNIRPCMDAANIEYIHESCLVRSQK